MTGDQVILYKYIMERILDTIFPEELSDLIIEKTKKPFFETKVCFKDNLTVLIDFIYNGTLMYLGFTGPVTLEKIFPYWKFVEDIVFGRYATLQISSETNTSTNYIQYKNNAYMHYSVCYGAGGKFETTINNDQVFELCRGILDMWDELLLKN